MARAVHYTRYNRPDRGANRKGLTNMEHLTDEQIETIEAIQDMVEGTLTGEGA